MNFNQQKDDRGWYYQVGSAGKKYYYHDETSQKESKESARKQYYAMCYSLHDTAAHREYIAMKRKREKIAREKHRRENEREMRKSLESVNHRMLLNTQIEHDRTVCTQWTDLTGISKANKILKAIHLVEDQLVKPECDAKSLLDWYIRETHNASKI